MNIYHHIPPQQPPNSYVGIDIEIFGMNSKTLHRPTSGKFACLSIATSPEDVYMIHNTDEIPMAMYAIKDSIWVAHNAKFDLMNLRRWDTIEPRKKLWDTLLIERILYGGYFDTFSLADLARRHLNIYMEKETRDEFRTAAEMDERMIQYAALDATITLLICYAQQKVMTKNDFKIWSEVDCPALWAVMDFKGMAIDVDGWLALAAKNKANAEEIKAQLPFNPDSPKQVKEYLSVRGFIGLKDAQADTLKKMAQKHPDAEATPLAIAQQQYKTLAKRASSYGENFLKNHLEYDNDVPVIIPDWNVTGAETGRMSCSDPALQTIPIRDTKEFRKCFIARPGHKIIVWDWSSQEPRITAHISQDKRLLQIFRDDKDIYCEMALDIKGVRIDKHDPLRKAMKPIFLGATYGLTKYGLAKRLECSTEEAEEYLNTFFKKYPNVAEYVRVQQRKKKYVLTCLGRKAWINPYNEGGENNALNSPIQGTAGDMLKQTFAKMHKEWLFDFPYAIDGVVHDEMKADVPEDAVDEVAKFGEHCAIEVGVAMCPSVPWKLDIFVGSSWACKE
jgi:DNA polymerase-1